MLSGIWSAVRAIGQIIAIIVLMIGFVFIVVDFTIVSELAGMWHHHWNLNPLDIVCMVFSVVAVPVSIRFWTHDMLTSRPESLSVLPAKGSEPMKTEALVRFARVIVVALCIFRASSWHKPS
jgi:hypothetical protein